MTIENTREQLEQMTAADIMEYFAAAGIEGEQDWDAGTTTYQHGGLTVAVSGADVRIETEDRYVDQPEGVKETARANWLAAYDDGEPITDAEIDEQIVQGRLYCPHCGAWDCDMSCAD